MRWRKQTKAQADQSDEVWNRAAMHGGGPTAREGDQALASLLRLHNEAMSSGLLHAVTGGLTRGEFDRALDGYRYFGLGEAATVAESVLNDAFHAADDEQDELEADADRRYASVVPDDSTLVQAFRVKLAAAPESFAPSSG
jgi:hypothetical protein